MTKMELYDDEIALIMRRREEIKAREIKTLFNRHVVNTTASYYEWLIKNRCYTEFSTFITEFNYEEVDGFEPLNVYQHVKNLLIAINDELGNLHG